MQLANPSMTKAQLFDLASKYNLKLPNGDARCLRTKIDWVTLINIAINNHEGKANIPTDVEVMMCIVVYNKSKREGLTEAKDFSRFALPKFDCTYAQLMDVLFHLTINDMVDYGKNEYYLTAKGIYTVSEVIRNNRLFVRVVDDQIVQVLDFDQFIATKPYFKTYPTKRYQLFVDMKTPNTLASPIRILDDLNPDMALINKLIENSPNEQLKAAIAFWKRYRELFGNVVI